MLVGRSRFGSVEVDVAVRNSAALFAVSGDSIVPSSVQFQYPKSGKSGCSSVRYGSLSSETHTASQDSPSGSCAILTPIVCTVSCRGGCDGNANTGAPLSYKDGRPVTHGCFKQVVAPLTVVGSVPQRV